MSGRLSAGEVVELSESLTSLQRRIAAVSVKLKALLLDFAREVEHRFPGNLHPAFWSSVYAPAGPYRPPLVYLAAAVELDLSYPQEAPGFVFTSSDTEGTVTTAMLPFAWLVDPEEYMAELDRLAEVAAEKRRAAMQQEYLRVTARAEELRASLGEV